MCCDLLKTESGIMQVVITEVPITYAHVRAEVVSANFTNRTVTTWDPTRFYGYSISYKTYNKYNCRCEASRGKPHAQKMSEGHSARGSQHMYK